MARQIVRRKTICEKKIKEIIKSKYLSGIGINAEFASDFVIDDCMKIDMAIKDTLKHLNLDDYLYHTNYAQIFHFVYLVNGNYNKTKDRLARDLYMSSASFTRATDLVIKCFECILLQEYHLIL